MEAVKRKSNQVIKSCNDAFDITNVCSCVCVCVPSTTTAAQQGLKQICARGPMTELLHL